MKPIRYRVILALTLVCSTRALCDDTQSKSADSDVTRKSASASSTATADSDSSPHSLNDLLDTTEKVLKIVAYIAGAAWVYFNYFKGRVYESRLEVTVAGEILPVPKATLAKFSTHIKNVGLSKVELLESGSAVRIEGYDTSIDKWIRLGTYSIFEDAMWIEPAETLEGQELVPLHDAKHAAYRAKVFVNCGSTTWESSTIFTQQEIRNETDPN